MSVPDPLELSIVIVNWNSCAYLRECIQSIAASAPELDYEVIVVDNASTRDDLDAFAADYPGVRLIRSASNIGFARANNLGFCSTRASTVLFLNPDTCIEGPALQTMLHVLKEQDDVGVVGCRLLNSDFTVQTSSVLRYPRLLNQALGTNLLYYWFPRLPLWGIAPLFRPADTPVRVEAVSGACLMIRRSVFERVGQFSEGYFMYSEDVDLCYKVAQAGFGCCHAGTAVVVHYGGGSSSQKPISSWSAVVQCGAKLQFMEKTRGATYGLLYRALMATSAVLRLTVLAAGIAVNPGRPRRRTRTRILKWWAILQWSLRPEVALKKLIAVSVQE